MVMSSGNDLAILGGPSAFSRRQPRYPEFSPEALRRLCAVLADGPTQGLSKGHPIVAEFEGRLAELHQVSHCLAAASGHGALQSALIGLEITEGDEVITSPYSWGASVSCILHNGAMPVFCDVLPDTGLIDPAALEGALTSRARAIMVPHLYGQPADMTAIMKFAEAHDLRVVEDGSQAHGARHAGRPVGSFGHASGFSINGVKPLASAEGGYLVTRLEEVYWKATISCQHAGRGELIGRASEPGFPDELRGHIDSLVYTYRPNVPSLVLALDRLPHLNEENDARRANAGLLRRLLEDSELFSFPRYADEDHPVFHMVTLNVRRLLPEVGRDEVLRALQAEGVPAVAYVERGLHQSPRMSPDWSGPKVMWTGTIRRSGQDPTRLPLPGCEEKVATSIEIPWNYVHRDDDLIAEMAGAFRKVEANLAALTGLR
ncbi:DegT/DnrJ/EryC1/StrS family aminotransferase [Actinomadura viridis]|uniref:dTDP-4-amino-4,6-dideoxygalactose transaminase n=1 Tax=Actinomadura viridis TaxID=58110 RepID=A0A931GLG6_9ACTN|nr:DegT/DnrJ/EryC1/StrS family aminotransferase [Actinomadura viridis]MBG6091055.1 dTDP-4-amino-4,6-dideoxygalactose transaminase [Actinomadura viridis]